MKREYYRIISSLFWPFLFVAAMTAVYLVETHYDLYFGVYGLYPREWSGLKGIVLAPFIHGDGNHLFNNAIPLLVLGTALFYFYREMAFRLVLWIVILGGLWTWLAARPSFHIGASGLLYGLFSFLLVSGFLRRHNQLLSISFLTAFLYGSLVWGLLPIDYKVSWESHLWGFIAGIALAFYYRKVGQQREEHVWDEAEEEALEHMEYWKLPEQRKSRPRAVFRYFFKPTRKDDQADPPE